MRDILDMEGWVVTGSREEGKHTVFMAEYVHEPKACTKCGGLSLYRHGTKKTTYTDAPLRGKTAELEATVRRYRCRDPDCGETFLQPLGGVLDDRRMTERCAEYIADEAMKLTFAKVAEDVGVDEKTVRAVASTRLAEVSNRALPPLPRVLGVDETQIHRVQRLVLTDIEGRKMLDMFPYRDEGALATWLARHRDRSRVEVVTIDMWRPYQRIVKDMLPKAAIVVDKFHVVRYASDALEDVRIRLGKAKQVEERRRWVRSRIQLLKRPHNLSEKQAFNLGMWLDNEPELAAAYKLKEAVYAIYEQPTKAAASAALDAVLASVPPGLKKDFQQITNPLKNWRAEILAFFDHPFTNAYTEALNGLIKNIVHDGRGYSFEVLRARALAKYGVAPKEPLRFEFLIKGTGNPCESCAKLCDAADLHLVTMPPVTRGQRAKRALVCATCEKRFNTMELRGHAPTSTRESG